MNSERGLLLFCCVVLLLVSSLFGMPLFSAAERLAQYAEGIPPEGRWLWPSLQLSGSAKVYAHERQPLLQELVREQRPDERIARLAEKNQLSAAELKAFLAVSSRGVADKDGMFWAYPLGLGENDARSAEERCAEAARQLGELRRQNGSFEAAALAWVVGAERAARLARLTGTRGDIARASRVFLPAPLDERAAGFLCQVRTLRAGLEASWPVESKTVREEKGRLLLGARAGQAVVAPLPGTVRETTGGCLLLDHGCGLRSEFCGLTASVLVGTSLAAGQRLGSAAGEVGFSLLLGSRVLDGRVILPP